MKTRRDTERIGGCESPPVIRNNCDDCSHQVIVGDAFYLNIRAFHSNERTRATRFISCLSAIARLKAHSPIVHMQAILLRHSHSPPAHPAPAAAPRSRITRRRGRGAGSVQRSSATPPRITQFRFKPQRSAARRFRPSSGGMNPSVHLIILGASSMQ